MFSVPLTKSSQDRQTLQNSDDRSPIKSNIVKIGC